MFFQGHDVGEEYTALCFGGEGVSPKFIQDLALSPKFMQDTNTDTDICFLSPSI